MSFLDLIQGRFPTCFTLALFAKAPKSQIASLMSRRLTIFGSISGYRQTQLRMIDVPVPRPKANQFAICLSASSMHIDEICAAQGTALGRVFGPKQVSIDQPSIIGSSVSGTVVELGDDVTSFEVGDNVIAIPNETGETGFWATYRCIPSDSVLAKPASQSHVQAAALTMASCVAWGAIKKGNRNRRMPGISLSVHMAKNDHKTPPIDAIANLAPPG